MDKVIKTTCKVTVTLELNVGGTWNDSVTIAQAHKDAQEQAMNALHRMINGGAIITGTPKISVMFVDRE